MNERYRRSMRAGLSLLGVVLFVAGMILLPLGHHLFLSLCRGGDISFYCALPHSGESVPRSSSEEHDPQTCSICVVAAEMFDAAPLPIAVVDAAIPVAATLPFVRVHVVEAVAYCFLARAPPVA